MPDYSAAAGGLLSPPDGAVAAGGEVVSAGAGSEVVGAGSGTPGAALSVLCGSDCDSAGAGSGSLMEDGAESLVGEAPPELAPVEVVSSVGANGGVDEADSLLVGVGVDVGALSGIIVVKVLAPLTAKAVQLNLISVGADLLRTIRNPLVSSLPTAA